MKHAVSIALLCLVSATLRAQDADPFFAGAGEVLLDPSRAGFAPGAGATVIHQDQWLQLPGAWRNDLLSVDFSARNTKKQVNSWLGLGVIAARERQGAGGARLTSMGLVSAVHLRTGPRSFLSSGMELSYVNGAFGEATGEWGSQYDGSRYDATIASGETWTTDVNTWMEARAGLSWTLKQEAESPRRRERDVVIVGVAADHLGRLLLREGSYAAPTAPMRLTAYGMVEVPHGAWENGYVAGELIAHYQGPFRTGRMAIHAGKHLLNTVSSSTLRAGFKAGLAYRFQDALLVNAALDLGKASCGLAYGWAVLNGKTQAGGRRTFELMVQFRGGR